MLAANGAVVAAILALLPLGWFLESSTELEVYLRVLILIGINVVLAVSLQLINGISGQFSLGHAGFMAIGAYMAGYPTRTYSNPAPGMEFQNPVGVAVFFLNVLVIVAITAALLVALWLLLRLAGRLHSLLPLLLAGALFAWLAIDISKAAGVTPTPPYLLWSRLIDALMRLYAWLDGHLQPLAANASLWLPAPLRRPLCFLTALFGGGILAALAGLLVGLPTLRLRGDYLAIATLGFAEIIRVTVSVARPLGGATGLRNIPIYANPADEGVEAHFVFPWVFGAVIITTVAIWRIVHSPKGRALRVVRDDEIAAASIGVSPTFQKVVCFVIGAFFAGVAGGLYAHNEVGGLHPDAFKLMRSIELVVIVTLGGLGSIWGAVIAAAVLTWLPEFLRSPANWAALALRPFGVQSADQLHLPTWLTDTFKRVESSRMAYYALLLIIIMMLRSPSWWKRPWRRRNGAAA